MDCVGAFRRCLHRETADEAACHRSMFESTIESFPGVSGRSTHSGLCLPVFVSLHFRVRATRGENPLTHQTQQWLRPAIIDAGTRESMTTRPRLNILRRLAATVLTRSRTKLQLSYSPQLMRHGFSFNHDSAQTRGTYERSLDGTAQRGERLQLDVVGLRRHHRMRGCVQSPGISAACGTRGSLARHGQNLRQAGSTV